MCVQHPCDEKVVFFSFDGRGNWGLVIRSWGGHGQTHSWGWTSICGGRSKVPPASPDRCTHLLTVRLDGDAAGGPVVIPSCLHGFPGGRGLSTDPFSRRSPRQTHGGSGFGSRVKGCSWSHGTGHRPTDADFLAAVPSISVPQNHRLHPSTSCSYLKRALRWSRAFGRGWSGHPRPLGTLSAVCGCFWLPSPPGGSLGMWWVETRNAAGRQTPHVGEASSPRWQ